MPAYWCGMKFRAQAVKSTALPLLLAAALLLTGCSTAGWVARRQVIPAPAGLTIEQNWIPAGRYGRQLTLRLQPRAITVHSTQDRGATARNLASLLNRGGLPAKTRWNRHRWNIWHYSVDDVRAVQHLPLDEQGEHADHEGQGNTTSIGIEICEFSDPKRQRAAVENAARLTAALASAFQISRANIVPHYHWPMRPNGWHKNCPRILLENGRPGRKWEQFLDRVQRLR